MNTEMREQEREAERWLDVALAQYGKVEPRDGLETRLLARLAAEPERSSRSFRWWGGLAFSAVALALALLWLGGLGLIHVPESPVAKVAPPPAGVSVVGPATVRAGPTHSRHIAISRGEATKVVPPSSPPKLEQFPSPAPLSDQEKLLARYVQEFPQRAALTARNLTELRKQDELEMAAPWPQKGNATGLEQEE